jgi:hypothetical protein
MSSVVDFRNRQATARLSGYTYNFAGALDEQTYPSGRVVKNTFKTDGDLLKVESKKGGASAFGLYVSDFSYTAAGAIKSLRLGNGRWETAKFNDRLQIKELGLGSSANTAEDWKVNYSYGEFDTNGNLIETKNTGNIAKQTISFNGLSNPFVQTYKFASLSRLNKAEETRGIVERRHGKKLHIDLLVSKKQSFLTLTI